MPAGNPRHDQASSSRGAAGLVNMMGGGNTSDFEEQDDITNKGQTPIEPPNKPTITEEAKENTQHFADVEIEAPKGSEEETIATKPEFKFLGRKRNKKGCLTCWRCRIKCGEERPVCENCIRSKRQCEGYSQRLVFKEPINNYRPPVSSSFGPTNQSEIPSEGLNQTNVLHDDQEREFISPISSPLELEDEDKAEPVPQVQEIAPTELSGQKRRASSPHLDEGPSPQTVGSDGEPFGERKSSVLPYSPLPSNDGPLSAPRSDQTARPFKQDEGMKHIMHPPTSMPQDKNTENKRIDHPSCVACKFYLLKCDGQKPCRRCSAAGIECNYPLLGDKHPSTLVSMSNLAQALSNQGKYVEAEEMHRETLALMKTVSGDKHPHTLASMSNLALTLSNQGKYIEAEEMHRETLALMKKVSGDKHPHTLASMSNFAQALSNQGKYVATVHNSTPRFLREQSDPVIPTEPYEDSFKRNSREEVRLASEGESSLQSEDRLQSRQRQTNHHDAETKDTDEVKSHEEPIEANGTQVIPTETLETPKLDRWSEIRKNAADRAARPASERGNHNPETMGENEETSDEEAIESRVARIKARVAELTGQTAGKVDQSKPSSQRDEKNQELHKQNTTTGAANVNVLTPSSLRHLFPHLTGGDSDEEMAVRIRRLEEARDRAYGISNGQNNQSREGESNVEEARVENASRINSDSIPKRNSRFHIPAERNLTNVDRLISQVTDEQEIKELKQQKRLLQNRQAALDSRDRKTQDMTELPHLGANHFLDPSKQEDQPMRGMVADLDDRVLLDTFFPEEEWQEYLGSPESGDHYRQASIRIGKKRVAATNCAECHIKKISCNGLKPCSRCSELGFECLYPLVEKPRRVINPWSQLMNFEDAVTSVDEEMLPTEASELLFQRESSADNRKNAHGRAAILTSDTNATFQFKQPPVCNPSEVQDFEPHNQNIELGFNKWQNSSVQFPDSESSADSEEKVGGSAGPKLNSVEKGISTKMTKIISAAQESAFEKYNHMRHNDRVSSTEEELTVELRQKKAAKGKKKMSREEIFEAREALKHHPDGAYMEEPLHHLDHGNHHRSIKEIMGHWKRQEGGGSRLRSSEQQAADSAIQTQPQDPTTLAKDTSTLATGHYPVDEFGNTNPGDLAHYDLNNTTQRRGRRNSFEGGLAHRLRSEYVSRRGPPPTTRGFDKILRNENQNHGDHNQNFSWGEEESSGEETTEVRVPRVKVHSATPSWADFLSKQRPVSPTEQNDQTPIDAPQEDFNHEEEADSIPALQRKHDVGSSGHSQARPSEPQADFDSWGARFPELGFGDASSREPSDVRLPSKERDGSSDILNHTNEPFGRGITHAKEENKRLGTRYIGKPAPTIRGPPQRNIAEGSHPMPGQAWALDLQPDPSDNASKKTRPRSASEQQQGETPRSGGTGGNSDSEQHTRPVHGIHLGGNKEGPGETFEKTMRRSSDGSISVSSMMPPAKPQETKPRLGKDEVDILEREFENNHKPTTRVKIGIARDMKVDLARINNWFQNRRAKLKQEMKQEAKLRILEREFMDDSRLTTSRKRNLADSIGVDPAHVGSWFKNRPKNLTLGGVIYEDSDEAERGAWEPYQRTNSPDALANDGLLGFNLEEEPTNNEQIQVIDSRSTISDVEHQHDSHGDSGGDSDAQIHNDANDERDPLKLGSRQISASVESDIETSNARTNSEGLQTTNHRRSDSLRRFNIVTDMEQLRIETANNGRASNSGSSTSQSGNTDFIASTRYEDKLVEEESLPNDLSEGKKDFAFMASNEAPFSSSSLSTRSPITFTPEDDLLLIDLKENKSLSWKQIAEFFPGRSLGTLQVRYSLKLKSGTRRTEKLSIKVPWSLSDDRELARLVMEHGPRWNLVSKEMKKHTPEDCEQRYYELYRPIGGMRDDEASILESSTYHKYGLHAEENMNKDFYDTHSNDPPRYRCQICMYDSKHEATYKEHMNEVHNEEEQDESASFYAPDPPTGDSLLFPPLPRARRGSNASSRRERSTSPPASFWASLRRQQMAITPSVEELPTSPVEELPTHDSKYESTYKKHVNEVYNEEEQDESSFFYAPDPPTGDSLLFPPLPRARRGSNASSRRERSTSPPASFWASLRRQQMAITSPVEEIPTYDSKQESSCKKHVDEVHGLVFDSNDKTRGRSRLVSSPSITATEDEGKDENVFPRQTSHSRDVSLSPELGGTHLRPSVDSLDPAVSSNLIADSDVTQSGINLNCFIMSASETIQANIGLFYSEIGAQPEAEEKKIREEGLLQASRSREDDDISLANSTHSTMSVASMGSVFSLLSGLTGSSASSLQNSQDVIERLVVLFLGDETIRPACSKALEVISRERFERNLRRLLKSFAVALRQEAETEDQRDTARFVLRRATNTAHLICNKLQQPQRPKQPIVVEDEVEEPFEDSESDHSENFDSLQHLEAFIKESNAMDALRSSLLEFVEQNTLTMAANNTKSCLAEDADATTETNAIKLDEARSEALGAENVNDRWSKLSSLLVKTSAWSWVAAFVNLPLDYIKVNPMFLLGDSEDSSLRSIHQIRDAKCIKYLSALLVELELTRPPIESGKKRVEWQCKCGQQIYDDFTETNFGAAERFQRERISKNSQSSFDSSKNTAISIFSGVLANMRSLMGQANEKSDSTLPMHERSNSCINSTTSNTPNQPPQPPKDLLYLLLCYSEGRYATRLLQVDLISKGAGCDKTLFHLLRQNYQSMRGRFLSYLSFRTLTSIKFVSFELYRSQLVDVRKQDDIPPPEHAEYRYQPAPPELIPPIGERHMMHLFSHPDHAEDEPICLDRFPKKLKEKLLCRGGSNPGWGLQFVEGWDMRKIWGLVFLLFGLGSLLIGVLWSVFEHSIQDAFTMAGYMVAMATVSMGTIQAFLVS